MTPCIDASSPALSSNPLPSRSAPPISLETLAALKQKGLDRYDVVAFAGIESLLNRAAAQREKVRVRVFRKAQQALDHYIQQYKLDERMASDQTIAEDVMVDEARLSKSPHNTTINALIALRQYVDGVDVNSGAEIADSDVSPVDTTASAEPVTPSVLPALKSSAAYHRLQHQQRIDQFMDAALNAKPENPGPLNPETLAIRLLTQINDVSPEYISHYVTYFDTLQWLHNNAPSSKAAK